ncbi:MAG: hypothetical protein LIR46_12865 [Bacteroidota bacterium]|nr:hypothetical protein [Bacteroidota bacterium]
MIKIIAIVLAAIIAVAAIGTLGFMVVKSIGYMVHQHFNLGDAISWSWTDYCDFIGGIFGKAKAESEDYWERDYTINRNIEVKGCTSL